MISLQQGLFRSIQTTICRSSLHIFQPRLVFLLPRFKPPSLRRQLPLKSSVSAKLKEEEEQAHGLDEVGGGNNALKQKLESVGLNFDSCTPGQYTLLTCPLCKGGQSKGRTLSFHINQNEKVAIWRCFNFECGWAGHVLADEDPIQDNLNKVNISKKISEETLRLEPLGDELIEYFAARKISEEILKKNAVMQLIDDKNVIAYTYRRKGQLVNCKFRSITTRRFWQAKHGERILYGLDGIEEGNDIVIVEGEIDKLSMEEAGIINCVSVPDGAPQQVSTKSKKQETRFKYLTDCNGCLDKADRVILATDGDGPGQALAEELSCRLGKQRCWVVTWPKKDEITYYKDANEVLVHLGAEALRNVVENAKLYESRGTFGICSFLFGKD